MKIKLNNTFFLSILMVLMIFEIPYFNLFLVIPFISLMYIMLIQQKKVFLTWQMLILSVFIILYFYIDTTLEQSATYKTWYAISAISMYMCGYYIEPEKYSYEGLSENVENKVHLISAAYLIYVLITIIYSMFKGQFGISRNPLNIWTGLLRAATHYGTMLVLPVAYGAAYIVVGKGIREKIKGVAYVILSIIVTIIIAGRTILYFTPLALVLVYFYNIKVSGTFKKKHMAQLIACIVLIVLFLIFFKLNLFYIQSIIMKSQLGMRYLYGQVDKIAEDGRAVNIKYLFSHINESLMGGGYTRRNSGDLHNIYLNVFDLSGIIPFFLLICFSLNSTLKIRKAFSNKILTDKNRVIMFSVLSLAFIQLLLEPVMESVPVFCWCVLYILGCMERLSCYSKKLEKGNE